MDLFESIYTCDDTFTMDPPVLSAIICFTTVWETLTTALRFTLKTLIWNVIKSYG